MVLVYFTDYWYNWDKPIMDIRGWLSSDYEMSNGDNVPGAHDVYVGINARGTVTNFNGKYGGSRV